MPHARRTGSRLRCRDRDVVDLHLCHHDECAVKRVLVLQVCGDKREEAVDIAVCDVEQDGDKNAGERLHHQLDIVIRWAADAGCQRFACFGERRRYLLR